MMVSEGMRRADGGTYGYQTRPLIGQQKQARGSRYLLFMISAITDEVSGLDGVG